MLKGNLLSIITINYNNLFGLEKTFDSIFTQTDQAFEYIVIDGGSNDGSKGLIEKHDSKIAHWVSEPDNGIYNAMNKGIKKATGEYLLFLNSGDFLYDKNVIKETFEIINKNDLYHIYYGNLIINDDEVAYPNDINLYFLMNRSIPHPSTFIKKSLFDNANNGKYREDYKIISDWIFFVYAYINQYQFYHLNKIITVFNPNGLSSVGENNSTERKHAMVNLFPNFLQDIAFSSEMKFYKGSRAHQFVKFIINLIKMKNPQRY